MRPDNPLSEVSVTSKELALRAWKGSGGGRWGGGIPPLLPPACCPGCCCGGDGGDGGAAAAAAGATGRSARRESDWSDTPPWCRRLAGCRWKREPGAAALEPVQPAAQHSVSVVLLFCERWQASPGRLANLKGAQAREMHGMHARRAALAAARRHPPDTSRCVRRGRRAMSASSASDTRQPLRLSRRMPLRKQSQ